MSTIALPSLSSQQVTAQSAEKKKDRTQILTQRLLKTLEGGEGDHVCSIDPKNHREGFKKLVESKRAKKA